MKDLNRSHIPLFHIDSSEALNRVRAALDFLWDDKTHSMHDKVAGDFDYEELTAALLYAEKALSEAEKGLLDADSTLDDE